MKMYSNGAMYDKLSIQTLKDDWKIDQKKVSNCRNILKQNLKNFQLYSIPSESHLRPVKWIKKWTEKHVFESRESDLQDATYCKEICQNLFILKF